MLLSLYDKDHRKIGPLPQAAQVHLTRTLAYGDETLDFEAAAKQSNAEEIRAEGYVRTKTQEYVIKTVEGPGKTGRYKVAASLNIEDLEGKSWPGGCAVVEQPLDRCLTFILEDTGWTATVPETFKKKRTVRIEDDTTTWELVKAAIDTYRVDLEIDSLKRILKIHEHRGTDRGSYAIEGLNLKELGRKVSSYGFATRLIPIGKDGMGLWVEGQNYIENHQYSQKVVTAVWRDERYTNTTSLQEDATARLDEMSRPVAAYTAKIEDLAAYSKKYSALAYGLGDDILLVSASAKIRTKQRIVKMNIYPDDHKKDTVELSNVKKTFAQLQKEERDMAKQEAINITKAFFKVAIDGYATSQDVTTAIRVATEAITLDVKKNFSTKAETEQYAQDAKADADAAMKAAGELSAAAQAAAEAAAKEYTDSTLTSYSTTLETNAVINAALDGIKLELTQKYATKETVEANATQAQQDAAAAQAAAEEAAKGMAAAAEKAAKESAAELAGAAKTEAEATAGTLAAAAEAAAKAAAKEYTDTTLTSYSTTAETKAAIDLAMDGINLELTQKYATKATVTANAETAAAASAAAKAAADAAQGTADAANQAAADANQAATDLSAAAQTAAEKKAAELAGTAQTNAEKKAGELANQAEGNAKGYTDTVLVDYSTTAETTAAINLAVEGIKLEVSQKYATTTTVKANAETAAAASAAAKAAADAAQGTADAANQAAADANQAATDLSAAAQTAAEKKAAELAGTAQTNAEKKAGELSAAAQAAAEATAGELANQAEGNAKGYVDTTLVEYSTTVETQSLIDLATDAITMKVSREYATKATVKAGDEEQAGALAALDKKTADALTGLASDLDVVRKSVEVKTDLDGVRIEIQKEIQKGMDKVVTATGYRFDEVGMLVSKAGKEMSTQITENGMQVRQNETPVLTANNVGVDAKNLRASTFLIIGAYSRLENFGTGRTGCFWIGG